MGPRAAAWLAWSLCGLCLALFAGSVYLLFQNDATTLGTGTWGTANMSFILPVVVLAFTLVGALLSSRLPANPIGWICLSIGLALMLAYAADGYDVYALETRPGSLPGGEYAAWLENWLWAPPAILIGTFLILLFPNGRLPSRRWRVVAWLSVAVMVSACVSEMFRPGPLPEATNVINPLGIVPAGSALELLNAVSFSLLSLCFAASALSMILRFRRSTGVERQQLKWFAFAGALLAAVFPVAFVSPWGIAEDFVSLSFAAFPVAVGIAILRHRLYDIDVIINRALVYVSLTATLAAVYVGSVVTLQYLFRALTGQEEQPQLAIVASTLAIAALFSPLRRRIQSFIDRRFYRSKYDARETLDAFSARLRTETDLDRLGDGLVEVVSYTMQPTHAGLWLRPPGVDRPRESQG